MCGGDRSAPVVALFKNNKVMPNDRAPSRREAGAQTGGRATAEAPCSCCCRWCCCCCCVTGRRRRRMREGEEVERLGQGLEARTMGRQQHNATADSPTPTIRRAGDVAVSSHATRLLSRHLRRMRVCVMHNQWQIERSRIQDVARQQTNYKKTPGHFRHMSRLHAHQCIRPPPPPPDAAATDNDDEARREL